MRSVNSKTDYVIELMIPFEENIDRENQNKPEKYEDFQYANIFPYEIRCRSFVANSTCHQQK